MAAQLLPQLNVPLKSDRAKANPRVSLGFRLLTFPGFPGGVEASGHSGQTSKPLSIHDRVLNITRIIRNSARILSWLDTRKLLPFWAGLLQLPTASLQSQNHKTPCYSDCTNSRHRFRIEVL
jgi:hypothetical protein